MANPIEDPQPGEGFWVCEIPTQPLLIFKTFQSFKNHQNAWVDEMNSTQTEGDWPQFDVRFQNATNLKSEVFLLTERYYFARAI